MVSREHVDLCLAIQRALRDHPDHEEKPIGEILIEKGLLTPEGVERLLDEQREWEEAKPARPPTRRVPAAKRTRGERQRAEPSAQAEKRRRGHTVEFSVAAAIVVVVIVVVKLWPDTGAQRTLTAYLDSCYEKSWKPDKSLAIGDLGIMVRQFEVRAVLPATRHDYGGELRAFGGQQGTVDWRELIEAAGMADAKKRVLSLLIPGLSARITPKTISSLVITVQPVRCRLVFKPRGKKLFEKRDCQFFLLRAECPKWKSGWRVGGYERIKGAGGRRSR
jgi:hypothetical protein